MSIESRNETWKIYELAQKENIRNICASTKQTRIDDKQIKSKSIKHYLIDNAITHSNGMKNRWRERQRTDIIIFNCDKNDIIFC